MTRILPSYKRFLPVIMGLGLLALVACGAEAAPTDPLSNTPGRSTDGVLSQNQPNSQNGTAPSSVNLQAQNGSGLHVSGQGTATAAPDMATLSLGVEATASTVAEARGDAAAAMQEVIDSLREAGVPEEDIQTTVFNISAQHSSREVTRCPEGDAGTGMPEPAPQQECFTDRESVITGYQVTNQVSATVRDLDTLGDIIDSAAAAGGDLVRFQGIHFSIEDTSALEDEARSNAVADLRHRAEELARLMDVGLGQPMHISEGGVSIPRTTFVGEAAAFDSAAARTPIQEGEITVTVTVQASYNITAEE